MQAAKVHIKVTLLMAVLVLGFIGIVQASDELVIYSGRTERFVLPLIQEFQAETGISVQLLSGDAAQYVNRLQAESRHPRADLFISNDGALLEVARERDLLMPIDSARIQVIPENFRSKDDSWVGLAARSRIFMYNQDLISASEMPQSIFDLVNPRFRGQFVITRAGNSSMVSHISAIRTVYGDKVTKELLAGILANNPTIVSGHTDVRRAVGAGEFKFGLVNNYYFHLQLEEKTENNVAAIYPDQEDDEMGVFVNISGVGLVNGAPNQAHAVRFIEFLLTPENQRAYSYTSKETPLLPDIESVDYALRIDEYKVADIHLSELGLVYNDTLDLMEAVGFAE